MFVQMTLVAEARLEAPVLVLIGGRARDGSGWRAAYRGGPPGAQQQTLAQGVRCGQLRLLLDE